MQHSRQQRQLPCLHRPTTDQDKAMTYQHNPDQINQLADDLENPDFPNGSLTAKAAFHLRELQRRIADLEAQLYAIGASNLSCKSTQKRLATLWGYVKQEPDHLRGITKMVPARKPLTDEQIKSAVRHLYGSDAIAAMAVTGDIETARVIEEAHGITGSQQ